MEDKREDCSKKASSGLFDSAEDPESNRAAAGQEQRPGGKSAVDSTSRSMEERPENSPPGHRAFKVALNDPGASRPVERLFPFVLRSRTLLVGRDTLRRGKSRLHFVLITVDISQTSIAEILSEFAHYPVVQCYTSEQLKQFFGVKGAKVIGFEKSEIAQSIFAELKQYRINTTAGQRKGR